MTSPTKPSISHTYTFTNMSTNKVRNKHPLMQHKVRMKFSYNMNSHFCKFPFGNHYKHKYKKSNVDDVAFHNVDGTTFHHLWVMSVDVY
jgi:hypothetical protein